MIEIIKNSINLHLQQGDKIKAVHITSEDLEVIKKESYYVLNLLEQTSFYDKAECDGYCLFDDIENFIK